MILAAVGILWKDIVVMHLQDLGDNQTLKHGFACVNAIFNDWFTSLSMYFGKEKRCEDWASI